MITNTLSNYVENYILFIIIKETIFKKNYLVQNLDDKIKFILNYAEICNINDVFMNVNNDDLMHMVLESFYTNNFNFNLNNISSYTEDNVNIYNILSLYDQNYIEDLLNIFNFKYNKTNPVISNYFNYLNITNNYWKENIISLYDQYYEDENNLSTKVNDIFDNNKICEHGIIINFIDNFIPY